MGKIYTALGLMSGTSMDGVDASIIQTDGKSKYKPILDKYFKYPERIYNDLTMLRDKIETLEDLKKYQKQTKSIEKDITIFHGEIVETILKKTKLNVDFLGFHGQTIYHNANEKTSKQLGDGKLLSKLTKKKVVYDFRKNDLKNGGQGAPLTPIFHQLLTIIRKIDLPVCFINLGGIANITILENYISDDQTTDSIISYDIGPANCLIDAWIRKKSKKKFDNKGLIAKSGKVHQNILNKEIDKINHSVQKITFDIKDFDLSFAKSLSLSDGAATLTEFTAQLLSSSIKFTKKIKSRVILCGGGRKNKFLVQKLKKINKNIESIDEYGIDGDFVESQAFGYLAIRSFLKLPISFPETTKVFKPCTGGVIIKNF